MTFHTHDTYHIAEVVFDELVHGHRETKRLGDLHLWVPLLGGEGLAEQRGLVVLGTTTVENERKSTADRYSLCVQNTCRSGNSISPHCTNIREDI